MRPGRGGGLGWTLLAGPWLCLAGVSAPPPDTLPAVPCCVLCVLPLLLHHQTIFSMSGDAAKLDRFERRFAWFKVSGC